ncbi:MAG: hypothetical protein IPN33_16820 [Saprospiraceae bacterium]|nr:hypothetical protein [Saprospiraceae bacterium]
MKSRTVLGINIEEQQNIFHKKTHTAMLLAAALIWFIIAAVLFEVTRSDKGQGEAVKQRTQGGLPQQSGPAVYYPQGPVISPDGDFYWDPVRNRWVPLQSGALGNILVGVITVLIVALCVYYWYSMA